MNDPTLNGVRFLVPKYCISKLGSFILETESLMILKVIG